MPPPRRWVASPVCYASSVNLFIISPQRPRYSRLRWHCSRAFPLEHREPPRRFILRSFVDQESYIALDNNSATLRSIGPAINIVSPACREDHFAFGHHRLQRQSDSWLGITKQAMSSTDLSTPPLLPTATKKLSSKSSRPSKRIILRLSPHLLAKYPSAQPVRKASRSKPPASVQPEIPASSDVHLDVAEDKVELQPTHAPEVLAETTLRDATPNPLKRKGVPGPKPGAMKRVLPSLDANGLPKPRGKPGPKKRIKL